MKRGPPNSNKPDKQTTLGQYWSSKRPKENQSNNNSNNNDDDDDDDIELLAAAEAFERGNSQPSTSTSSSSSRPSHHPASTTTTTTTTTASAPATKWPISYKAGQETKQTNEASVSAPANENEAAHTYPDFDRQSGRIWIYPTNYEKREYQYKTVKAALFQNTLVVLPTGLGKTFIAAVVMFNYCRWYPTGKIIFTAPTKPLVAQQMDACAKVMGIRRSEMCEMTGGVNPEERRRLWLEKRVFFLTPQTLNNDLVKSTCPWSKIRCLVIDEAHRALGQHAYCQVVQELLKNGEEFRVLALSATPGNTVEAVQNVIQNLKIAHIEMFTDDSPDIKKYSFDKIIDKIVVGHNQLMQDLRRCILSVLKQPFDTLSRAGIFHQKGPEDVKCGFVIIKMKHISKDKPPHLNDRQYQEVKSALFFAISFYHALDELEKHGLQSVYNFFKKKLTEDKKNGLLHSTFRNNLQLSQMYTELQNLFDLSQVSTQQRRTTSMQVAHPKLAKLRECIVEHFQTFDRTKTKANDQTRVIIFSEKRDSVREITELLQQDQPLVKPMAFIGQASSHAAGQGINQKLQKKVVNEFRAGGYNVLVSTSIGEEGLDIGSVDLIICFDALKSPIRLVQRMGRTGRARQGRIILLMTEGSEENTYYLGEMQQKRIFKLIIDGARMLDLYRNNLRMVPLDIEPVCQEMMVKINDESDPSDKTNAKKFKSNDMDFNSMLSKTKQQENILKIFRKDKLLNDNEFYLWVRSYQVNDNDLIDLSTKEQVKAWIKTVFEKYSNEQRDIQCQSMHSSQTKILVDFMKNYSTERVFVDIPDQIWPIDEPIAQEISIPNRPKIPSPFSREKLKEQIQMKQTCSPLDLANMPQECDQLLNLQPIVQQPRKQEEVKEVEEEEIDCGDLFGTGSVFDITSVHQECTFPPTSSPTQKEPIANENIGNFDVTMDDIFESTQQPSHQSPTLQLNDFKSQPSKDPFDDDENGMDDDELLEAFNKHFESSTSTSLPNPSPILVLTGKVNTQISTNDLIVPRFDLEFDFDDLDNSDEQTKDSNNSIQSNDHPQTSISESTNKLQLTTCSDKFETPLRPVRPRKRVRHLSAVTPDIIEKKKCRSAQELGFNKEERHFHRRLASDFLDREAELDENLSEIVSSDEDENDDTDEHDHFIDDRQVLTQMANIDMTGVYLRSIKSPKLPTRPPPRAIPIEDIYSQLPQMTMYDDSYEEDDSFVDDTTQIIEEHHGEVDFDELANILGTQSAVHRKSKVTRRGVRFGRTSATPTPKRKPARRVHIAESPM